MYNFPRDALNALPYSVQIWYTIFANSDMAAQMKEELHRLNCFVENKPGVLARIVGLISGRGYNIQTLSVGPTEDGTVSRMKIDLLGNDRVISQIILQLQNQVNVIEVTARRKG